jgi:hypothetical protein
MRRGPERATDRAVALAGTTTVPASRTVRPPLALPLSSRACRSASQEPTSMERADESASIANATKTAAACMTLVAVRVGMPASGRAREAARVK